LINPALGATMSGELETLFAHVAESTVGFVMAMVRGPF
jgi:hypothetical protein